LVSPPAARRNKGRTVRAERGQTRKVWRRGGKSV